MPRSRRKSTWSFISASSGRTTGQAVQEQGGQLEAERLSAARGEDGQRRPARQQQADHLELAGAELREAEDGLEHW